MVVCKSNSTCARRQAEPKGKEVEEDAQESHRQPVQGERRFSRVARRAATSLNNKRVPKCSAKFTHPLWVELQEEESKRTFD